MGKIALGVVGAALDDAAGAGRTGCLAVMTPRGRSAIWLREGAVVTARRCLEAPRLGIRLAALGVVSPAAVAHADDLARRELPKWRLGELLICLGYTEPEVIGPHIAELLRDDVTMLCGVALDTSFRSKPMRSDVYPRTAVPDLLDAVAARRAAWAALAGTVGGVATALRAIGAGSHPRPEMGAVLAAIGRAARISDVAGRTGLTLLEVAASAVELAAAGRVDIARVAGPSPYPVPTEDP